MKKFGLIGTSTLAMIAWGSAASAAVDSSGSDIIVTATKRTQTLQDVPISVSVTSSDTIQKAQITDIIDLQTVVPSLKVYQLQNTGQTGFSIRGFGNGTGNPGIEGSVGVFVDGVYRSRSASSLADLPDIERIEVLRGPQSTLFGKNVSVGAISIVTKAPNFKWGGYGEVTLGNYGEIAAKASINAPLSDTIAVRLSGSVDQRSGYTLNTGPTGGLINNRDRYSLRGDLLFKPSANFSLRIIADYNHINEICCTVQPILNGPATLTIPKSVGVGLISDQNPFAYKTAYNFLPTNNLTGQGISAEANLSFSSAKLTSITSYRDQKYDVLQDIDFTAADIANQASSDHYKTFTQEFRLASTGKGPFSWLVGAFYSNEDISTGRNITYGKDAYSYLNGLAGGGITLLESLQSNFNGTPFNPTPIVPFKTYFQSGQGISDNWRMKDQSYSFFGQADYKLFSKLTLTGGVAYLNDHKAVTSNVQLCDTTLPIYDKYSCLNLNSIPSLGLIPVAALGASASTAPLGQALGALGYTNIPTNLFSGSVTNQNAGLAAGAAGLIPGETPAQQAFYQSVLSQSLKGVNALGGLKQLQFFKPPVNIPNANESGILNGNKVTFTGRIAYEITKNFNFYASYSTGWKAGAYNLSSDSSPPNANGYGRSAQPEQVTVYEAGLKTRFKRGYFNLAVFKEVIKGFQSNAFTGTGFALTNAGQESTKGFEVDASYRPVNALVLTASATYLEAQYDSFLLASCSTFPLDNPCGAGVLFHDLSGHRVGSVPKWSASASATYNLDLHDGYGAFVRGEYDYASSTDTSETVPNQYGIIGVSAVNASAGISTPYKLDVTIWARNLTNDHTFLAGFQTTAQSGSYSGYPNEPRRYGVTIRKTF